MPKKATKKATKKAPAKKPTARKATKKASPKKARDAKYVYFFGPGNSDGDGSQKALLGGKGANLAEMSRIGLPVPAGMTITTEVCTYYYDHKKNYPKTLDAEIKANIAKIEKVMGKKFGDLSNPLLLSVRSGARESMPGMMDTVLNLGMNDAVVEALAKKTNNPKFAWDCYRRFLQMYGSVVMGVEAHAGEHHDPYEVILDKAKAKAKVADDSALEEADLQWVIAEFKKLIKKRSGKNFPENPLEQLYGSVNAVFNSWNNDRAKVYRQKYGIPAEWGYCGECPGDGLRQHRQKVWHRSRLHAGSRNRRKCLLRGISHRCPGRRCGGRCSYPEAGQADGEGPSQVA